jgi:hypothetical protein
LETRDHLFFACTFSKIVGILLAFFGIIPYRFLKDLWLLDLASDVLASWKLLLAIFCDGDFFFIPLLPP